MASLAPPADPRIAPSVDDGDGSVPGRYLALLADVAERLLAAGGAATMVDTLFALIRDELRLDVFFNYRLDGERLVLEAHGGLSEDEARDGAVLTLGEAVCGCVAQSRTAVHAINVQGSDDPLHAFVRRIGLDAYACTPLLHGDRLLGTLGFGRRWADRFTSDELRFLHTVCHYVALAKYRLLVEAELRQGVAARERLLDELNHRVRNALQVAIGLVTIELAPAEPDARPALRRAIDRLQVLALAHRPLYAGGAPDAIDVGRLIAGVVEDRDVAVEGPDTATPVSVETAAALALLVHTLLSRQPAGAPRRLGMTRTPDVLRIDIAGVPADDGAAAPADRRIAAALAGQLRCRIEGGADRVTLTLPIDPAR